MQKNNSTVFILAKNPYQNDCQLVFDLLYLAHKSCVRCKLNIFMKMLHLPTPALVGKKLVVGLMKGTNIVCKS